jgi:hypothetical protein
MSVCMYSSGSAAIMELITARSGTSGSCCAVSMTRASVGSPRLQTGTFPRAAEERSLRLLLALWIGCLRDL